MLRIFCFICFFLTSLIVKSQQLTAYYNVTRKVNIGDKQIAVSLKGSQFRKGNRYIYFETPLYLNTYPEGKVVESSPASNRTQVLNLPTDTIQWLWSADFDSLIVRLRQPAIHQNDKFTFVVGYQQWSLLKETKEINGLHCQAAVFYQPGSDKVQWKVWFCADVPMDSNLFGIIGLPGLVVEADMEALGAHYQLESYDSHIAIPDSIFWPGEFNEPFTDRGHRGIKTIQNKTQSKSRSEKQQELLNNQN